MVVLKSARVMIRWGIIYIYAQVLPIDGGDCSTRPVPSGRVFALVQEASRLILPPLMLLKGKTHTMTLGMGCGRTGVQEPRKVSEMGRRACWPGFLCFGGMVHVGSADAQQTLNRRSTNAQQTFNKIDRTQEFVGKMQQMVLGSFDKPWTLSVYLLLKTIILF